MNIYAVESASKTEFCVLAQNIKLFVSFIKAQKYARRLALESWHELPFEKIAFSIRVPISHKKSSEKVVKMFTEKDPERSALAFITTMEVEEETTRNFTCPMD